MGFLDDAKDKPGDAVDDHGEQIGQGIDEEPPVQSEAEAAVQEENAGTSLDQPSQ
jgi:hypothetical protein